MNTHNLAQKTNYIAGSSDLELTPFYLTSVNIPGINFSHPELSGRAGAKAVFSGDSITYNALSFELLIDEDFNIYHEFMNKVFNSINPYNGTFATITFNFWIQINNSKGHELFKIEFFNCRIESIGDIQLDSQDDITVHSMNIEIKYDYYTINTGETVSVLRT